MRVLIVYPKFYIFGGAEVLIVRLCNHLTKRGIKNGILTTEIMSEVTKKLARTDIHIKENGYTGTVQSGEQRIKKLESEIKALEDGIAELQEEYNVINVHNFPAELAVENVSAPVVWMCNEPEIYLIHKSKSFKRLKFKTQRLYRSLYKKERRIVRERIRYAVVADEYNADRFKKLYSLKPEIINYGIDYDFFSAPPARSYPWLSGLKGRFVALHVGMITELKNQMKSLKTVARLKKRIPEILLVFAGGNFDAEYRRRMDAYIRRKSLEGHVLFLDHLDSEEMRALYHAADFMLHPIKAQGGWLSPFEMLSARKPVIVSKEMTASALISRENIGIVTNNYIDAIMDLYRHPEKYAEMAVRGSEYVRTQLQWERYCDGMIKVFRKSLG